MNGKRFSLLALVALVVVLVSAPAMHVGASGYYTDPQGRFAVLLGDNWKMDVGTTDVVASFTLKDNDNVTLATFFVDIQTLQGPVNVDDIAFTLRTDLVNHGYPVDDLEPLMVSGLPARNLISYKHLSSYGADYILRTVITIVAQGNTVYILDFAALNSNWPSVGGAQVDLTKSFLVPGSPATRRTTMSTPAAGTASPVASPMAATMNAPVASTVAPVTSPMATSNP